MRLLVESDDGRGIPVLTLVRFGADLVVILLPQYVQHIISERLAKQSFSGNNILRILHEISPHRVFQIPDAMAITQQVRGAPSQTRQSCHCCLWLHCRRRCPCPVRRIPPLPTIRLQTRALATLPSSKWPLLQSGF